MTDVSPQKLLDALAPRRLLVVGRPRTDAVDQYCERAEVSCTRLAAAEAAAALPGHGRHDLALVSDLHTLAHEQAGILLGQLRDLYALRVFVWLDTARGEWSHGDMIGHGYSRVGDGATDAGESLYRFDIADYKTTPDWLNDRYWANPQLYDKFRW